MNMRLIRKEGRNYLTLTELKKEIFAECSEGRLERPLLVYKIYGSYGKFSDLLFVINGSPPKGYALLSATGTLKFFNGKSYRVELIDKHVGIESVCSLLVDIEKLPDRI